MLLDETSMKEGKIEGETAIFNIRGITELIEEQAVEYNFQFASQRFDVTAPTIVFSTGRSMFKNALPVPIEVKGERSLESCKQLNDL